MNKGEKETGIKYVVSDSKVEGKDWDVIDTSKKPKEKLTKKRIMKEIFEWVVCILIAYILYLFLNFFLGTVSGVKQVSMYPTALEGDKLLLQRPTIFKKELRHGDIITFEAPTEKFEKLQDNIADYDEKNGIDAFLYSFMDIGKMSYVKRIIGLPGDHIVINETGEVYVNNEKIDEAYVRDGTTNQIGDYNDLVVPENTVFVMGDNRLQSRDSRVLGCIPQDKINGYVLMRIWPFNRFGKV